MDNICPLCRRGMRETPKESGLVVFCCETCGRFLINQSILLQLKSDKWNRNLHLISATTKEAREPVQVDEQLLKRIQDGEIRERTVDEKIELMVRWFASRSYEVGQSFVSIADFDYPAAWCRSPSEWSVLLRAVASELGYLKSGGNGFSVSVSGWRTLVETKKTSGSVAFVAMPFNEELNSEYDAIRTGIASAGYEPVRVDKDHYTGGVMDQILARIRESRFVIAEFAGNRGGVYYEAGFALGLGIPTICLCSQTQLKAERPEERLHFDVDHLNFLPWEQTDLPRLTRELRDRILALFGRGPQ